MGDKVPTISFTEKFIDSVSFSSRDVSSKSWESIGDFGDYESVEDKVLSTYIIKITIKLNEKNIKCQLHR